MIPAAQPVTIHRHSLGAVDAHNNPADVWTAATPILVHGVAPGASQEALQAGRDVSRVAWTVYAPAGVSVAARDRVAWLGITYEVLGDSLDWSHGPWANPAAGVVFELGRSEG